MVLSQGIGPGCCSSSSLALRGDGPAGVCHGCWPAAAGGLAGIAGLTAFYRALAIGKMSIVAPIAATGVCDSGHRRDRRAASIRRRSSSRDRRRERRSRARQPRAEPTRARAGARATRQHRAGAGRRDRLRQPRGRAPRECPLGRALDAAGRAHGGGGGLPCRCGRVARPAPPPIPRSLRVMAPCSCWASSIWRRGFTPWPAPRSAQHRRGRRLAVPAGHGAARALAPRRAGAADPGARDRRGGRRGGADRGGVRAGVRASAQRALLPPRPSRLPERNCDSATVPSQQRIML